MKRENAKIKQSKTILVPKQQDIYGGLQSMGEEIAAFYLNNVRIFENVELDTKSYLLILPERLMVI